jgi:hypothetical protein
MGESVASMKSEHNRALKNKLSAKIDTQNSEEDIAYSMNFDEESMGHQ